MPENVVAGARARVTGLLKSAYAEKEKGNESGAGRIYRQAAKVLFDAYKETKAAGSPNQGLIEDAQRWNLESNYLLGKVKPSLQERLDEIPAFVPEPVHETLDLTAVKGLSETKERIMNTVAMRVLNLLKKPDGLLLYGPPGTGKTLLARALAGECTKALAGRGYEVYFFNIDRAEVQSHLFGVTEKNLKSAFETAKKYASKSNSISLLFIDELHGLISSSATEKTELGERVAATFYTLLDGLSGRGNILPIGATNYPTKLPPPLLRSGRYGVSILIPPPDLEARTGMFQGYVSDFPDFVFNLDAGALAARTDGYSGADIKGMFERVVVQKMRDLQGDVSGNRSLAEVIEDVKKRQVTLKASPVTTTQLMSIIGTTASSLPLWYAEMGRDLREAPTAVQEYFKELFDLINAKSAATVRPIVTAPDPVRQILGATAASGDAQPTDTLQKEIDRKRREVERQ